MPEAHPLAALELRNVSKRYGEVTALADVSLALLPGRTTVLLGASGSGKSTVLRALLGLVQLDDGQVLFQGQPLTRDSVQALRRKMGYCLQGGGLFPHLTVRDNASLLAGVLRWDSGRIEARLRTLTELTRLPWEALSRYPAELSGGQAQRVALMRALMLNPDVLLLDEPLGALDPDTRFDLQADLKHVVEEVRKTVILVTHDLPEAYFLGDRWTVLRGGRVLQEGSPDEVLRAPADSFIRRFVASQRSLPAPVRETI